LELDNIIENANPMDFFQYLVGQNSQVDDFIETLKTRNKIAYEEMDYSQAKMDESKIGLILRQINSLDKEFTILEP